MTDKPKPQMTNHALIERVARALHEAHRPWCDYTYAFDDPMSSREVYETLAEVAIGTIRSSSMDDQRQTTIDEAVDHIPSGWFWERMLRLPLGYLVSLERMDGDGVAQSQYCATLPEAIMQAAHQAREWDKESLARSAGLANERRKGRNAQF